MSSSKTPIRQDEKDYLDHFIETKYDDRKNVLKTEMQDTIDKEAEDNFEAFKDKLKINKMHDDVRVLYEDHAKFANEMDSILLQKKGKLDKHLLVSNLHRKENLLYSMVIFHFRYPRNRNIIIVRINTSICRQKKLDMLIKYL